MKTQILIIVIASGILWSCNTETNSTSGINDTTKNADTTAIDKVATADPHNAQTALDWDGTYKGVTPCADCEGIDTEIMLNKDMTFVIRTIYIGKSDKIFEEKGTFKWDGKGSRIIMEGLKDRPAQFFVGENTLTQLDLKGEKVTGELASSYVLKKQ